MVITKKSLPRRTVLRGIGVTLALPWLDSMVPALTALTQSPAAPARRLGVFYVPNGMALPYWRPAAEGPLTDLPPILQPLQRFKDRVLMIGGLTNDIVARQSMGGGHSSAAGTFLSSIPFVAKSGADVTAAITMDQLLARENARETQIASLELGMEAAFVTGECENSCSLTNTISWSSPTTALPIDNDPRSVFERLFGMSGSTDIATRLAFNRRQQSILDVLNKQVTRLNAEVGPTDRTKIEQYLESLRDVERRIQIAEKQSTRELPVVIQPLGIPSNYGEHAKLMMDLLALAYQTDMTRVSTFMLARELSGRAYPEAGIPDSHHPVSHHQNNPGNIERLSKINHLHMDQFAYLVEKLASIPEGDGTVLDNTLLMYGAAISDSNVHSWIDLPIAVVGSKQTGVVGGRYLRFPDAPLANLNLTLLDNMGLRLDVFGNSTGTLDLSGETPQRV